MQTSFISCTQRCSTPWSLCLFILLVYYVSTSVLVTNIRYSIFFPLGIAIGLNKGKKVTQMTPAPKISYKKGAASNRTKFVRSLVREIAGLSPYERRLIDLIRNSGEKRARKVAKKRLGSFTRAKAKVEEMNNIIAASRRH